MQRSIATEGGGNTVPCFSLYRLFDPAYRLLGGKGFSFHPLGLVANYCIKNNIRDFYTGDLAQFSKKNPQDLKAAMEFLSEKGLVTYFPKTDFVHVKEKAILIYKSDRGDADYDNLKIHSVIDSFPMHFKLREALYDRKRVEDFKTASLTSQAPG